MLLHVMMMLHVIQALKVTVNMLLMDLIVMETLHAMEHFTHMSVVVVHGDLKFLGQLMLAMMLL